MQELELCNMLNQYCGKLEKRIPEDQRELTLSINRELIAVMQKHIHDNLDISAICLSTALFVCISHQPIANIDVNT